MDKYTDGAKKIIEDNIYLTLATSTPDGKPWISPLFFTYDKNYNLYWVSNKNSRHSQLIAKNPRVAITIFDSNKPIGEGDAVYFEATAENLESPIEIETVIPLFNSRVIKKEFKINSLNDVTGKGLWKITKATPVKVYKLVEGEVINGQYVDRKIEVTLA